MTHASCNAKALIDNYNAPETMILPIIMLFCFTVFYFYAPASKNKDKEVKVKTCTNELKEIKDMASDVIHAVKSGKRSTTEDPGSMKSVLKELLIAIGTFFDQI